MTDKIIGVRFDVRGGFVVERAHFADYQYADKPENIKENQEALRAYANSRVRDDRYKGDFRMPELLIKQPIPLEKLTLHVVLNRVIVGKGDERRIEYVAA